MFEIPPDLNKPFPPNKVKKNQRGFDYVAIEDYITRLNDALGSRWSWTIKESTLAHEGVPPTDKGKPQFMATVRGTLSVVLVDIDVVQGEAEGAEDFLTTSTVEVQRDGIGASLNFDPDNAVKTAQAEALKKACHQYGVALYLWHAKERDFIALQKRASSDDGDMKRLAVAHAQRFLEIDTMPTADQIAEVLGIKKDELSDMSSLREALVTSGVL
jgi:hypothetical protein